MESSVLAYAVRPKHKIMQQLLSFLAIACSMAYLLVPSMPFLPELCLPCIIVLGKLFDPLSCRVLGRMTSSITGYTFIFRFWACLFMHIQDQSCTIHNSFWSIHEISQRWLLCWDEIQNVVWRWRMCREEVIKPWLVSASMVGQKCSRHCLISTYLLFFASQVYFMVFWTYVLIVWTRFEGTIIDIEDKDCIRWPNSEWRCLKVPQFLFMTLKSPNL